MVILTDADIRVSGAFYKHRAFPAKEDKCGWQRLEDMLVKREVFFAAPSTLNDPFDCYPRIELLGNSNDIRRKAADLLAGVLAGRGVEVTVAYRSSTEFEQNVSDLIEDLQKPEFRNKQLFNDKVVQAVEERHLPAPEFRVDSVRTTCILHGPRDFSEMSREDRIRACYQHCCLRYVSNESMTNQSLRERFRLTEGQAALASQVIAATQAAGRIKLDGAVAHSKRYARYLPFWA